MTTSIFQLGPAIHLDQPDTFIYNGSDLSWLCSNSIYTLKKSSDEGFELVQNQLALKTELLDAHITDSYISLLTPETLFHGPSLDELTQIDLDTLDPSCVDVVLSRHGFLLQSSSQFGGRYTLYDWNGQSWKLPVGAFEARIFPEELAVVWWEKKSDILYRWAALSGSIHLAGQMLLPIIDVQLGQWPIIIVESKKERVLWSTNTRIDLNKEN